MITWPGMILTTVFGVLLIMARPEVMENGWFHAKLGIVLLLVLYHINNGFILKKLAGNSLIMTSGQLRLYNELPTVFLFTVIFLVVLKNLASMTFAIASIIALSAAIMLGVQVYKMIRK